MEPEDDRYAVIARLIGEREEAKTELTAIDGRIDDLTTQIEVEKTKRQNVVESMTGVERKLDGVLPSQAFRPQMLSTTPPVMEIQRTLDQELSGPMQCEWIATASVPQSDLVNDDVACSTRSPVIPPSHIGVVPPQISPTSDAAASTRRSLASAGITNVDHEYPVLSEKYSNIVRIDGEAYAISCFVGSCRANAPCNTAGKYFRGIKGLKNHIVRKHPEYKDMDDTYLAQKCRKTALSLNDARRLEKGLAPETKIRPEYGLKDHRTIKSNTLKRRATRCALTKGFKDLPINEKYTHIIHINDQWVELKCKICGANYSSTSKTFFNGLRGIKAHLRIYHQIKLDMEDVLDHCTQRIVSERDVEKMTSDPPQRPVDKRVQKRLCNDDDTDAEDNDGEDAPHQDIQEGLGKAVAITPSDPSQAKADTLQVAPGLSLNSSFSGRFDGSDSLMRIWEQPRNGIVDGTSPNKASVSKVETYSVSSDSGAD